MSTATLEIGNIYPIKLEKYQLFYLCQIIDFNEDKVAVVLLNYFNEKIPNENELTQITPLIKSHHLWKDETLAFWTDASEFENLSLIGNTEKTYESKDLKSNNSLFDHLQPMLQFLWQKLPPEKIAQYKEALNSENRTPTNVAIDSPKEPTYWKTLDDLPMLTEINATHWDDQLIDYVEKNHFITKLELRNITTNHVDISKTAIQSLFIDAKNVEKIILNDHIKTLSLLGDCSTLKHIEHPYTGKHLLLHISGQNKVPEFTGIENLENISIVVYNHLDIDEIPDQFEHLSKIKFYGKAGKLSNILSLSKLKKLEELNIFDAYGFDDFPSREQLPNLKYLDLTSIPKTAGQKAKKEFSKSISTDITQLRDAVWIKTNLENPFRDWHDREGTTVAEAKKASKNYTDTFKKLTSKKTLSDNETKELLLNFIKVFNQMDKKRLIDTIEREEIWEVYNTLSELTNLSKNEYEQIFDTTRNF